MSLQVVSHRHWLVKVEFNRGWNSLYSAFRLCHLAITDIEAIHRSDNRVGIADASRLGLRHIDRNRSRSVIQLIINHFISMLWCAAPPPGVVLKFRLTGTVNFSFRRKRSAWNARARAMFSPMFKISRGIIEEARSSELFLRCIACYIFQNIHWNSPVRHVGRCDRYRGWLIINHRFSYFPCCMAFIYRIRRI